MQGARVFHVSEVRAAVEAHDWDYASSRQAETDAYWNAALRDNPALFNGRVLLMHRWEFVEEEGCLILDSAHFETGFKEFLAWRAQEDRAAAVRNCFAPAALCSADGVYFLGVMGDHTASAGKIYFPAGTPDPGDVRNGKLDLAQSALRELEEETGIEATDVRVAPGWTVIDLPPRMACMREMTSLLDAKALAEAIAKNLARQKQPELAGMYQVRTVEDIDPARMPLFMQVYLRHALAGKR